MNVSPLATSSMQTFLFFMLQNEQDCEIVEGPVNIIIIDLTSDSQDEQSTQQTVPISLPSPESDKAGRNGEIDTSMAVNLEENETSHIEDVISERMAVIADATGDHQNVIQLNGRQHHSEITGTRSERYAQCQDTNRGQRPSRKKKKTRNVSRRNRHLEHEECIVSISYESYV